MKNDNPSLIVYPGTFDPITLGHLDLVERAAGLFDRVVLAVAAQSGKPGALFSAAERVAMAREVVAGLANVEVRRMDGMLVDFCRALGARVLLRGIRVYSDFEYEFQMALTNRKLAPEIETLFMIPKEEYNCVSSSIVREIESFGGDAARFVPPAVQRRLQARLAARARAAKKRGPE
ncbi:MAG: pantetheine-phosphate adenylyltransferase [Kiritimatiellae bacterium]|nr:pantetheine-phosphate adenylyltransferase [Kiritimatiellia bacterium]